METEGEAVLAARFEIAASLSGVERPALEEDVGGLRELRGVGEHVGKQEVEIRVASANSGGVACAPRNVGMPPASRIARSDASSVFRSRP